MDKPRMCIDIPYNQLGIHVDLDQNNINQSNEKLNSKVISNDHANRHVYLTNDYKYAHQSQVHHNQHDELRIFQNQKQCEHLNRSHGSFNLIDGEFINSTEIESLLRTVSPLEFSNAPGSHVEDVLALHHEVGGQIDSDTFLNNNDVKVFAGNAIAHRIDSGEHKVDIDKKIEGHVKHGSDMYSSVPYSEHDDIPVVGNGYYTTSDSQSRTQSTKREGSISLDTLQSNCETEQRSGSETDEFCPVCGDKVSGYHYGLLTCESCKGFFKRTVQNKKVYTCVAERSCHIDKTQRKRCPFCRFQKCLEVGMKLEAVRADRMRGGRNKFGPMYKRDRARKLQMMRQRQLALQAIRTSIGSSDYKGEEVSPPNGYQPTYPNMNIKQEIQIPQVSSLTQSPDSSPSPIAIALGQVHAGAGTNNLVSLSNGTGSTNPSSQSGSLAGSSSNCEQDSGNSALLRAVDSKQCFDSGANPSSTADSVSNGERLSVSPMIREFVQSIDDREWQQQLYALLQKQSYNQVEVDLFELMCKVLDQNLFSQVDWARNTVFFKDLRVDDQMKLLQHSWSDMLVLDHLHQRIHNKLPDETPLNNGQMFNLLGLGLLGVPQLADYFNELQKKLRELKFDMGDYVCMKFLILLNPNVRGIQNKKCVLEGHENVQAALLDYTLTCYSTVTEKFSRMLSILPEIHAMAARGEEHLYHKHCAGSAPTQTLLMEMLHAKRKV